MKTDFDVTIGLIIRTTEPVELISEIMGILPSKSFDKGDKQIDNLQCYCHNTWIHRMRYEQETDIEMCIQRYIDQIPAFASKIINVKKYGTCTFRISIVSLYAQMYFHLSSIVLQMLNNLDIPCEVSVFSYGNCIDETNHS